ncbi:teichoic acid transporter [Flavobacterium lutivivi]|nr:teichoic acid transporter [Flavobacterium lutivivi]
MSQIKKGAILSYLNIILTNGIGLILTPFMIRKLGDSEYGLYTLIGSLIGYISVLDFGLNNTIVRFVSKYRALKDEDGEKNFLATTMLIYGIISAIVVIIGIVLFFNLDEIFKKLTPEELYKAKIMFVILIFNMATTLPGGAFTAISNAYERFVFPRALVIIKYILRSVMLVMILLLGSDSIGIVVLDTLLNVIVIAISAYYVFKTLKVKMKLIELDKSLIKQIFNYSFWIFIFAMVGQFQWRSGQVILGVVSGTKDVAIFGVGIMLGTYYGAFSTAISSVFLPRATQMTVLNATSEELTSTMIRIGRFSLITLLMIFGGFLIYGQQFIHLWVGDTYTAAWAIALIIMFSYTLPLIQSFANSLLESKSLFSFKAKTYITLIVLGTVIGAYMIKPFGVLGLIIGSTAGWILSQVIMNFYYSKILKLEIGRFFREVSNGLLPSFIGIISLGYVINFLPGEGWLNLVIKILAFTVVFCVLIYKFGMNKSEKEVVHSLIPKIIKR